MGRTLSDSSLFLSHSYTNFLGFLSLFLFFSKLSPLLFRLALLNKFYSILPDHRSCLEYFVAHSQFLIERTHLLCFFLCRLLPYVHITRCIMSFPIMLLSATLITFFCYRKYWSCKEEYEKENKTKELCGYCTGIFE